MFHPPSTSCSPAPLDSYRSEQWGTLEIHSSDINPSCSTLPPPPPPPPPFQPHPAVLPHLTATEVNSGVHLRCILLILTLLVPPPNHVLQSCPTFDDLRHQTWPSPGGAHRKLWGPAETAADCGFCLTHWTEDLAWRGAQKKKKKKNPSC